ncbi:MAG: response regulator [Candidatus Electryonea clarkiae]|nr:response regulator [Candidatus Electryonea clarkiae]MDP8287914.1 response regulator [Candidatus Electryonea clarkiae]
MEESPLNQEIKKLTKQNLLLKKKLNRAEKNLKTVEEVREKNQMLLNKTFEEIEQHNKALDQEIEGKRVSTEALERRMEELSQTRLAMLNIMEDLEAARIDAESATEAKSDFLANMSHEIRTPMNAVIGMTHLCLQTDTSPKQTDYLHKTQTSAHALLGIINDILDFSKIEAGKLDVEEIGFNLDEVLENLANLITVKAQEKGLEIVFSLNPDVPINLTGDPLRLGQILINLASNSVKFTEQGEIVVSIELESKSKDKVHLKFSVKDSGIGMTEEQLAKLFQAFSQADTSTTRKFGGTGLGLTISKRLVEMMGGDIHAESVYGEGTTFYFTAEFGIQTDVKPRSYKPSIDTRGMRVLVVDDNEAARETLQSLLEAFTFKVTTVSSGKEAIAELRNALTTGTKPYDLVLMDWKMPGLNGVEATEIIKNDPEIPDLPAIIMVTAYGREEVMQQADEVGMDGFLIKPVTQSVLFDTIMESFGKELKKDLDHKKSKQAETIKTSFNGAMVLLVEDNEINQQVASELLQNEGIVISIANNGLEAVQMVTETNPGFETVLMDLQMPEMDGYEATKRIRKESRFDKLPIIAMTADAMVGVQEECLAVGMNDYVTKPIDPNALFKTLEKWIKPRLGTEAKSEKKVSPQKKEEIPEIPEMVNIDVKEGLTRIGGNKKLYWSLLEKYVAEFQNSYSNLLKLVEDKMFEDATRLAHTIKGVSGNIGAKDVFVIAEKVEAALKNEDIELFNSLNDDFESKLNVVINEIKPVLALYNQADSEEEKETGSLGELKEFLIELKDKVKTRKPKQCEPVMSELKSKEWSSKVNPQIEKIGKLLKKYQFKKIDVIIDEIIDSIA